MVHYWTGKVDLWVRYGFVSVRAVTLFLVNCAWFEAICFLGQILRVCVSNGFRLSGIPSLMTTYFSVYPTLVGGAHELIESDAHSSG